MQADQTAENGSQVADDGRQHADDGQWHEEGQPAAQNARRWHQGEEDLPAECEKVQHVVLSGGVLDVSAINVHGVANLSGPRFIVHLHRFDVLFGQFGHPFKHRVEFCQVQNGPLMWDVIRTGTQQLTNLRRWWWSRPFWWWDPNELHLSGWTAPLRSTRPSRAPCRWRSGSPGFVSSEYFQEKMTVNVQKTLTTPSA